MPAFPVFAGKMPAFPVDVKYLRKDILSSGIRN